MGILCEDVVVLSQAEKPGDSIVITINCPDKTGLGCDLCRIILLFGLSTCRGGTTADWWSVGVILFELIVGIPPFNAEHPQIIDQRSTSETWSWRSIRGEAAYLLQRYQLGHVGQAEDI
ncbi:ACT domain-containing protein ACR10-like isoform X2 [Pistacia vera]|uniref:ACT domain-containing protein ACR10-like isoform X1 n=1 Tax=Pistacia vera TaxID=55513 RepID=UPI0012639EBD|nr:ACT domain-containing protein ACR10-like isoform X1 [Pistacia vera]XP_031259865.1 ACT domain-containing protein ACR10-like isoform X2 [Pistacia vera]